MWERVSFTGRRPVLWCGHKFQYLVGETAAQYLVEIWSLWAVHDGPGPSVTANILVLDIHQIRDKTFTQKPFFEDCKTSWYDGLLKCWHLVFCCIIKREGTIQMIWGPYRWKELVPLWGRLDLGPWCCVALLELCKTCVEKARPWCVKLIPGSRWQYLGASTGGETDLVSWCSWRKAEAHVQDWNHGENFYPNLGY